MKIKKVFNNNAVLTMDKNGDDIILLGSGLGFQKKKGDEIDQSKIERIFYQDDSDIIGKLQKILSEIPQDIIDTSREIIKDAKLELGKELNDNLYISLPDHINFAIEQYKAGICYGNRLTLEIKKLYQKEFEFAEEKVELINERFGTHLGEDEAASIVLHLINAQENNDMSHTIGMVKFVERILSIITQESHISYDESSLEYFRLVTHLKFFYERISQGKAAEQTKDQEIGLLEIVKTKYERAYNIAYLIKMSIRQNEKYEVRPDDLLYLTIHIQCILEKEEQ